MFAWLKQRVSAASEAVAPLLRTNLATMQAAWARLQEDGARVACRAWPAQLAAIAHARR
jgi:hypothetical protein